MLEADAGARHVQAPRARDLLAGSLDCLVPMALESLDPGPERQGVMGTQQLDVDQLEAGLVARDLDGALDGDQLAIRKDIPLDEP